MLGGLAAGFLVVGVLGARYGKSPTARGTGVVVAWVGLVLGAVQVIYG